MKQVYTAITRSRVLVRKNPTNFTNVQKTSKNLFLNVCQRSSSWSWIVCGAFVEKVFFSCLEALSAPTSFFEDGQQRSIVKAWKLETCLTTTTAQTRPRSGYDFVSATRQLAEGWKTRSVQQATEQQNKTFALDASFVRFA